MTLLLSQKIPDTFGNQLLIMETGEVFLHPIGQLERKKLGTIYRTARKFIMDRQRHTDYNNKYCAYGFNKHLLTKAKSFDTIVLRDEYGEYEFPVSAVLENGKAHNELIETGLNLQLFLPLRIMKEYNTNKKSFQFTD